MVFVQEEFEDTKGVIRVRQSKKADNTMVNRKSTNNNLQTITHILKIE